MVKLALLAVGLVGHTLLLTNSLPHPESEHDCSYDFTNQDTRVFNLVFYTFQHLCSSLFYDLVPCLRHENTTH